MNIIKIVDRSVQAAVLIVISLGLEGCSPLRPAQRPAAPSPLERAGETRLGKDLLNPIQAHPGQSGFYLLNAGMDAFVSRVLLADAADHTIDLQYYIIRNDTTTRLLFDHLLHAADRGVRVRILVDDIHTGEPELGLSKLNAHPNIQVRVFKPFRHRRFGIFTLPVEVLFNPVNVSQRMHNKLFAVDEQAAIVGGRNLGDSYFDAQPDVNFQDVDVLAVGPVVGKVTGCFEEYWNSDWAVPIGTLNFIRFNRSDLSAIREALEETRQTAASLPYIKNLENSDLLQRLSQGQTPLMWAQADVISDSPAKVGGNQDQLYQEPRIQPFAEQTRSEMELISPYFIPGRQGLKLLAGLRQRGVRIRVLTNSLNATDILTSYAGYTHYRKELLRLGVEIYEFKPEASLKKSVGRRLFGSSSRSTLHAKTYVFDREVVIIGSFNIDPRSLHLNTEMGLVIYSPELARQVLSLFEDATAPRNSYHAQWAGDKPGDSAKKHLVWDTVDPQGKAVRLTKEPGAGLTLSFVDGLFWVLPLEGLL